MRYEIKGETLPVVICHLEDGEQMVTEKGAMSWMSPNMKMESGARGGLGESIWQNVFRRFDFSEHLYCGTGKWDDCLCVQFPGLYKGI